MPDLVERLESPFNACCYRSECLDRIRSQSAERPKIVAYEDAHAVALELGYPSLTEALEDLARLQALAPKEGCVTVPVAATETMIRAGRAAKHSHGRGAMREIWSAMLSASPSQVSGPTREEVIRTLEAHIDSTFAGPHDDWTDVTGIEEAADAILSLFKGEKG